MERLGNEWDWGCESPKESIFKKLLNHTGKKKNLTGFSVIEKMDMYIHTQTKI